MGRTQTSSPVTVVPLGLVLALMFFSTVHAQGCQINVNIDLAFPELDPPAVPSASDPRYAQLILSSSVEPFSLQIEADSSRPNNFPFDEYFRHSFNPVGNPGYYVYMIKGINRDGSQPIVDDDMNILQYLVKCRQTSSSLDVQFASLKIQIIDVNDNSPEFQNDPYSVSVSELVPIGSTIFRNILTSDLDEGPNKQVSYTLSDSSTAQIQGSQTFYLPSPSEGFVVVLRHLDFESLYRQTGYRSDLVYYNLTITATDGGTPQLSSKTTLIIRIEDDDDLGPEFVYPSCISSTEPFGKACISPQYRTSIPSGSERDALLVFTPDPADPNNSSGTVEIIMQDRDTLNSSIACRIARTRPPGYESSFTASTQLASGKQYKCNVVYNASRPIFRNDVQELEIAIEAVELSANRRTDDAIIIVEITSTGETTNNPDPLVISSPTNVGYILENSTAGTRVLLGQAGSTVFKFTFSDPDSPSSDPSQFDVQVSKGSPFIVTQEGYVELCGGTLDFETTKQYSITVTVTTRTPQRKMAWTTLTINVLDVNDNWPVFPLSSGCLFALVPVGNYEAAPWPVLTVWASDADFGPVHYALSHVKPASSVSKFQVDASGLVTVKSAVAAGEVFYVYITASDSGSPVRSTDTVVVVTATVGTNQPAADQCTGQSPSSSLIN